MTTKAPTQKQASPLQLGEAADLTCDGARCWSAEWTPAPPDTCPGWTSPGPTPWPAHLDTMHCTHTHTYAHTYCLSVTDTQIQDARTHTHTLYTMPENVFLSLN